MPRPRFSDWILTPQGPVTIAAGGSYTVTTDPAGVFVDMIDTFAPQIAWQATWQATASTTGMQIKIYRMYPGPTAISSTTGPYTDPSSNLMTTSTGTTITPNTQPTASSGSPQTITDDFNIDSYEYPRRLKIVFTNLDGTNGCTLFVSGDR